MLDGYIDVALAVGFFGQPVAAAAPPLGHVGVPVGGKVHLADDGAEEELALHLAELVDDGAQLLVPLWNEPVVQLRCVDADGVRNGAPARQPEARDVRRDRVPHGEVLPTLVGTGFTGAEVGHLDQQPVVVPLVVDALLAVGDPAIQVHVGVDLVEHGEQLLGYGVRGVRADRGVAEDRVEVDRRFAAGPLVGDEVDQFGIRNVLEQHAGRAARARTGPRR